MALGVSFQINGDGSKALAAINAVQQGMIKLGDTAKGELSNRIKTLFSAVAIEEAVRRTGEWAQQLDRTAQSMGTTSDKLQTLQRLAANANVDEGKVTGFFDELDSKRREAINGNSDLIQSFQAMGISYQDLLNMGKADLFGKLLGNSKVQDLVAGSPLGNALESLIGQGNIPTFQALNRTAGGQDLNGLTASDNANGLNVGNQDISEMASMWNQIKQDFSQSLVIFAPLGKLLLSLATILSESLLGALLFVKNTFVGLFDLVTGDFEGVKDIIKSQIGLVSNAVFGLVKTITSLIDVVAQGINSWIRKIPFAKKFIGDYKETGGLTGLVQKGQDSLNKKIGANKNEIRGGEGIGNLASIIASGGVGGAAKAGSSALLKGAVTAEKLGANGVAERLLLAGGRLEKYSNNRGIFGLGPVGTIGATAGAASSQLSTATNGVRGKVPTDAQFKGYTAVQAPTVFSGEKSAMLSLGGVFGSGLQTRLIRLNEQMVALLAQITRNTQYNPQSNVPVGTNGNPNTRYSGGI